MPDADSWVAGPARQAQPQFPVLKSSIPQRRDGEINLPHIPAEIYLEIFKYFPTDHWETHYRNKRVLAKLIPVCRAFRAMLLPRRLQSLDIQPDQHDLVKFATQIFDAATECNLFAFPQFISLTDWMPSYNPRDDIFEHLEWVAPVMSWPERIAVLRRIAQSLPQFVNVQQLTLSNVPISPPFFSMITEMKSLHAVFIAKSRFHAPSEQDGPLMQAGDAPPTPWTRLMIDASRGYLPYLSWIASLAASPALTYLESDFLVVQAILSVPCEFSELKTLYTRRCDDWLGLGAALNSAPAVTSLMICQAAPFPTTAGGRILQLAPGALPHLQTLQCPSALVSELVAGRPVDDLCVDRTRVVDPGHAGQAFQPMHYERIPDADIVGHLARSDAPLRRLHLSVMALQKVRLESGDDALTNRMAQLTCLDKLSFDTSDGMGDIVALSDRPIHSHVRSVCARVCKELDLQNEYMLIRQYFTVAYPRAMKFAFSYYIKWHRQEQRAGEATWTAVVKPSKKDVLRERILRLGEGTVTDFRGILKGLFTEEELMSPQLRHTLGLEGG